MAFDDGPNGTQAFQLELTNPVSSRQKVAMTGVIIARVLHVVAVVIWIGGVSMATTVIVPAVPGRP